MALVFISILQRRKLRFRMVKTPEGKSWLLAFSGTEEPDTNQDQRGDIVSCKWLSFPGPQYSHLGIKDDAIFLIIIEMCSHVFMLSFFRCVRLFADPMDSSLPGSFIHGIFQARVLEWGAITWALLCSQLLAWHWSRKCLWFPCETFLPEERAREGQIPCVKYNGRSLRIGIPPVSSVT